MEVPNLNVGGGKYFGPEDELPRNIKQKCIQNAKKIVYNNGGLDKDYNLEKDPEEFRESEQEFAFVSFIGPYESLRTKSDSLQINIRGCCLQDEIGDRIVDIDDKKYDIYTFEMNCWIFIPPNKCFMEDQEKHERCLNRIICKHRLEMELDRQMFEARKELMTKNPDVNKKLDQLLKDNEELRDNDVYDTSEDLALTLSETDKDVLEVVKDIPKETFTFDGVHKEKFNPKEKLNRGYLEGQEYCIISIVGDKDVGFALKIKGFYETEEEAKTKMELLKEFDSTFENYIVESYRWLPVGVDPNDIGEKVYNNEEYGEQLNQMYKEYNKQQQKAKIHSAKREVSASQVLGDLSDSKEIDLSK